MKPWRLFTFLMVAVIPFFFIDIGTGLNNAIVQLYGFSMEKTPLIVLEYFQRTLLEGLKDGVVNKSYRNVCQMLSQLLMALQYLESLAYVIHCNVAAKNILFQDSNLKLADFSFARTVVDDGFYAEENAQIPTRHSSPEVSLNLF